MSPSAPARNRLNFRRIRRFPQAFSVSIPRPSPKSTRTTPSLYIHHILLRCEAPVHRDIVRSPSGIALYLLERSRRQRRVRWIPSQYLRCQHQSRSAKRQTDFVSVHDTVSLAQNVGVRFKDRHQFLRRRELLTVENSALCLIHNTQCTLCLDAQIRLSRYALGSSIPSRYVAANSAAST
jgi:hypothetical protein